MSETYGAIDHFYEIVPGRWLLIGWSSQKVIEDVVFETTQQIRGSIPICPVRLTRFDVAQAFNDKKFNQAGFVAFMAGDGFSEVQSIEIGSQCVACQPLTLSSECLPWSQRLHDLLNLLHIQDLSLTDLKLLLHSGLHDLVIVVTL